MMQAYFVFMGTAICFRLVVLFLDWLGRRQDRRRRSLR